MDLVLVATADWDNPLWTNKQHLASRWGRLGHRVLYIESLGLRRPELSGRDLRRVWRRLRRANRLRVAAPGVWVLSPLLMPLHNSALVRRLNRSWLAFLVRRALRRIGLSDPVLWTYNPLAHGYLDDFSWKRVVYHCVDELSGSPGIPQAVVETKERELLAASDLVVASAVTLAEAKRPHSRRVEYLANAADFRHFARAADPATVVPDDLQAIPRPRIGFVGAVSNYKVDLEGLAAVFGSRVEWQLVMIGPVGEGQPGTSVSVLAGLPNVHLLGPRSYELLPAYLKGLDVCLLPNRVNRYTRYMFPLKFFEYLASGKPVVMSPLPALVDYRSLAYVAGPSDTRGFEDAVGLALTEPADAEVRSARIAEASRHDWDQQARRMLELVSELADAG